MVTGGHLFFKLAVMQVSALNMKKIMKTIALCDYFIIRFVPDLENAVHLAVAGGVFDGVFLCCPFSH